MIFTVKRASDYYVHEKPCEHAEPIQALIQSYAWGDERWKHSPGQFYIIRLESLDDIKKLIAEVGSIIIYESPNEAIPGSVGDNSPWKEAARGMDGEPLEILKDAHGIIIYDDYME